MTYTTDMTPANCFFLLVRSNVEKWLFLLYHYTALLQYNAQNTTSASEQNRTNFSFLYLISKIKTQQDFTILKKKILRSLKCTDVCPLKCLIKGSKWDWLGLIAYATPVMVNFLGPQGSDALCLCNSLITKTPAALGMFPTFNSPYTR